MMPVGRKSPLRLGKGGAATFDFTEVAEFTHGMEPLLDQMRAGPRAVSRAADRVREASALGFGRVALPARDANGKLELPTTAISTVADLPTLLEAGK